MIENHLQNEPSTTAVAAGNREVYRGFPQTASTPASTFSRQPRVRLISISPHVQLERIRFCDGKLFENSKIAKFVTHTACGKCGEGSTVPLIPNSVNRLVRANKSDDRDSLRVPVVTLFRGRCHGGKLARTSSFRVRYCCRWKIRKF